MKRGAILAGALVLALSGAISASAEGSSGIAAKESRSHDLEPYETNVARFVHRLMPEPIRSPQASGFIEGDLSFGSIPLEKVGCCRVRLPSRPVADLPASSVWTYDWNINFERIRPGYGQTCKGSGRTTSICRINITLTARQYEESSAYESCCGPTREKYRLRYQRTKRFFGGGGSFVWARKAKVLSLKKVTSESRCPGSNSGWTSGPCAPFRNGLLSIPARFR